MDIVVERKYKKPTYTISPLFIDGERFCEVIEDKDRGLDDSMSVDEILVRKVYGETAIPTGTYNVIMSMSQKYKKRMPEIQNVKGYSGIRIHSGNTEKDSLGCLILGKNTQPGMVTQSRATCNAFYEKIEKALKKGEKVTITIR